IPGLGCGSNPTRVAPTRAASPAPSAKASSPTPTPPASVHAIPFEMRPDRIIPGDDLHIDAVLSDRDDFVEGGTYRVRGQYTLHSHARAKIVLFGVGGETSA